MSKQIDIYIAIACVVIALLLLRCRFGPSLTMNSACSRPRREGFLPPGAMAGTWDDWDKYASKYGSSRGYWGQMAPGGGWTGNPYAPDNNPSSVWTYNRVGYPGKPRPAVAAVRPYTVGSIAHANDDELEYLWKSQLMESANL